MAKVGLPMSGAFVGQFSRRMQGYASQPSFALIWLEQQLVHEGVTQVDLIRTDMTCQASEQISMNNSIGSLRALEAIDWREFVDTLSIVEQTLRMDPADVYSDMDFHTRDDCRHRIERIARASNLSEESVAALAIAAAKEALQKQHSGAPEAHVGYYLLDNGVSALKAASKSTDQLAGALQTLFVQRVLVFHFAGRVRRIDTAHRGILDPWQRVAVVADWCTRPFVRISNCLPRWSAGWLCLLFKPQALPRMDYAQGIPPDCKTLVVVPTLLTDAKSIQDLVDELKVRYLANRDPQLSFALLTDFLDASSLQLSIPIRSCFSWRTTVYAN